MPSTAALGCLASTYTTPVIFAEVSGIFTNTMMMAFYRGGGRPEPLYAIETLLDKAARKLGMDGVQLRRLNTVLPEAMPYRTAMGQVYDCGDFPKNLEDALGMTGGNIFHGLLSWPFLEDHADLSTPAARWGVGTSHPSILMCGSSAQRGGAVSGLGGHNAAMAVMEG